MNITVTLIKIKIELKNYNAELFSKPPLNRHSAFQGYQG